jgi:tetratricopeptide (TPR) repeat protein
MLAGSPGAAESRVKDLKYGVILFEFYQQEYFDTLVEFSYAHERGGIRNHGNYPELLKGGVSLSYGLDEQARNIFTSLLAGNTMEEVHNRAWYYLAKMLYLRGDIQQSAATMSNIKGAMPDEIDQEYRYLAALINIKLGYFEEAGKITDGFDKDSPYAPVLFFNLGVALGKQKNYPDAIDNLERAAAYADRNTTLGRLADRSQMAIAYLYDENNDPVNAFTYINHVSTTGVFSNRALLASGWSSVNSGVYRKALAPLDVLQSRSMAIPEVQEAVLLIPHVYEKLGLPGRAAEGFISAYKRYSDALEQLASARKTLKDADVLELFVRNLDAMLDDNDWFGTSPSVSLNSLSPFLYELMSDHSFQSVLKDLRDLYAIRNNLKDWKQKRDDFDVMIEARSKSLGTRKRAQLTNTVEQQQTALMDRYTVLNQRVESLDTDDKDQVQWLLRDVQFELNSARMMTVQLEVPPGISADNSDFAALVDNNMDRLDSELENTNVLIDKVENVMLELVNAELGVHEQRLKYYRIQSHLAKVRILDRSLADLDAQDEGEQHNDSGSQPDSEVPEVQIHATGSDGDAA